MTPTYQSRPVDQEGSRPLAEVFAEGWQLDCVPVGVEIGDTLKLWKRGEWGVIQPTRMLVTIQNDEELLLIKGMI